MSINSYAVIPIQFDSIYKVPSGACTHTEYSGSYVITPTTSSIQIKTSGLALTKNITINKIPYSADKNDKGFTLVIGGTS